MICVLLPIAVNGKELKGNSSADNGEKDESAGRHSLPTNSLFVMSKRKQPPKKVKCHQISSTCMYLHNDCFKIDKN